MRTATFALFLGIIYLSVGLLGLIPEALTPPPADAPPTQVRMLYGYLFGLFPVNVLHSAAHLVIGAWGIVAWRLHTGARAYARAVAILYGALAVIGVIPGWETLFGLAPIHGPDVWLHAGTGAIAAYFGWRAEIAPERRAGESTDRRQQAVPVPHERRFGHSDRRDPFSEV